jgi:hypothetical protein
MGKDVGSALQAVARYGTDWGLVLQDVLRIGPIGRGSQLDEAVAAAEDGMEQLRERVAAKGYEEVRRYAGV